MIGFLVVETFTDNCTYSCDVPVKVWLDRANADAHAVSLNLGAYREKWISEENNRRMLAAEERMPRISPDHRMQFRLDTLKTNKTVVPAAFDALGLTAPPEDFQGPFNVREIEVE